ncbi:MAG: cytochrome c, partial [Planctomycetota bacterium]
MSLVFALAVPLFALAPQEIEDDASVPNAVTWSEHIAPIVFQNCSSCHRPGEAAPFPLLSYADAKKRGPMIELVTQDRYMPPWHPEDGVGEFRDARRLTEEEIAQIESWVSSGMAEGDPALSPKVPEFPEGWQLGEPDLVIEMPEE